MNWTRIAIPALALAIGAGATAAGLTLTGRQADSGLSPATSQPATSTTGPSAGGTGASGGTGSGGSGAMGAAGGMMGGGSDIARGTSGGLVPATRMQALAAQAARNVTRSGDTLSYHTKAVTLVALGAPGNRPGMYWQIDGVDGPHGPTVSVPAGAAVTADFADGDPGHPHGFELTTASPPYDRMAMVQGNIATPGAVVMPVPPPKGNLWYAATVTFKAPAPGTYHIICPVPGHAQQGMWATFIVR
ncbi:MAG: sulfocyanin-like copper-binding protein [Acidimicrobiales bacterium]